MLVFLFACPVACLLFIYAVGADGQGHGITLNPKDPSKELRLLFQAVEGTPLIIVNLEGTRKGSRTFATATC